MSPNQQKTSTSKRLFEWPIIDVLSDDTCTIVSALQCFVQRVHKSIVCQSCFFVRSFVMFIKSATTTCRNHQQTAELKKMSCHGKEKKVYPLSYSPDWLSYSPGWMPLRLNHNDDK